ncbi:MAG TPA: hypothetical protein VGC69_02100 [Bordetella sp.]
MNSTDLDTAYAALAHALTRVGEARAPLFLAMLCLSLMSRNPDVGQVLALMEQAEAKQSP